MRTSQPAFRSPRAARLSPLAAGLALAFSPFTLAIPLTVDNNGDSGAGTLRQAILDANDACETFTSNVPTITFTGPFTISPSSPLPAFYCSQQYYYPTIDGGGSVIAGGYDPNVVLNGPASNATCGLEYDYNFTYGGNLTVKGMKIQNFTYGTFSAGVCGNVTMTQNMLANNSIGVNANGPGSIVGDLSYGGNVFIGNTNAGVMVQGNTSVQNNRIGTLSGSSANGNNVGIYLDWAGTASIRNNVISGNHDVGIQVYGDYGGSDIQFNNIGVDDSGNSALGNTTAGIDVQYSSGTTIANNTIGGNGGAGISIYDSSVSITGNSIGVGYGGGLVPNATGIDAFCSGYIDISDNEIGGNHGDGVNAAGMQFGQAVDNVVRNNAGAGLRFTTSSCYPYGGFLDVAINTVTGNGGDGIVAGMNTIEITAGSVFDNAGKNINSLNKAVPVITSVVQNADGSVTIFFTQSGPSDYTFHVQFYANNSLVKPAGEVYLGDTFITITTSPESGSFTIGAPDLAAKGFSKATFMPDNISATSTQSGGTTSEFAQPMPTLTAPAATITPNPATFGTIEVDSSSPSKSIVVRSVGDQPLTFSYIGSDPFCYGGPVCYGGSFTCSTTCTTSTAYATGQLCTVTAQFTPIFLGTQSTNIYFCHNGLGSPQVLTLTGDAIPPPPLVLSPTDWDFGTVGVGNLSDGKQFALSNRVDFSLPIQLATTGEFEILNQDCGNSVPALSTCHIEVAFGPTQSGDQTGQLTVTVPPSDQQPATVLGGAVVARARLTGSGVAGGSLLLPDAVNLGAAIVGGNAVTQTVEIRNNGSTPVTLDGIQVSEPFTVLETTCGPTLDAGQVCLVTLGFSANSPGPATGTLTVTSSGGSAAIPVTALGQTAASPLIRVSPTSIGFGSRMIGSLSGVQEVTISNVGGADAASFSLASSAIDFIIAGQTCGTVLAAGASCTANVAFRPLGFGTRLGSLVVTSSAPNTPLSMNLSGTGCRPFLPGTARFGSGSNCAP